MLKAFYKSGINLASIPSGLMLTYPQRFKINVQQAPFCKLGIFGEFGEGILQEWYQPSQHTVWSDAKVSSNIQNLLLVPKQHAS